MRIEDCFRSFYHSVHVNPEDYRVAEPLIRVVRQAVCASGQMFFVIDCLRATYIYIKDDGYVLCGHTSSEMRRIGFDFFLRHTQTEDYAMLTEIAQAGLARAAEMNAAQLMSSRLTYHLRLETAGTPVMTRHSLTPLTLTGDGRPWLLVGYAAPSTFAESGHVVWYRGSDETTCMYDLRQRCWHMMRVDPLSSRQRGILRLAAQGMSRTEIAAILSLTPDTIKYHSRELQKRLNVKSMTEALTAAFGGGRM